MESKRVLFSHAPKIKNAQDVSLQHLENDIYGVKINGEWVYFMDGYNADEDPEMLKATIKSNGQMFRAYLSEDYHNPINYTGNEYHKAGKNYNYLECPSRETAEKEIKEIVVRNFEGARE